MSTFRFNSFSTYATTFLLIWIAGLFGAEGVFRLLLGDEPSDDLRGMYTQFGRGYRHRPFVDTGAKWSTGYFSVHTDGLGFRCDTARRMAAKAGDHVDLLLMGDSQGFGNGLNYEDTIAGTIARLASLRGYAVRNACVAGQHPPNQFELAQRLQDEDGLSVANYVYLFTPVALASCDSLTTANVGADGNLYNAEVSFATQARAWTKTHSVVYSRIRDAIRSMGIGVTPDEASEFVFRLYAAGKAEERARECAEFLKRFKEFAAQRRASVQLVYVPLTLEMDFDTVQRGASRRGLAVDPDEPFRVISTLASRMDVPLHDLRPVLRTLRSKGQQLALFPDFHYTAAVSKAAGESIWERFKPANKEGPKPPVE